jgi:hypothetical protein
MAINQNHSWEELEGSKCAIVEKMVYPDRAAFLQRILQANGFEVRLAPSPPPKAPTVPSPEASLAEAAPAALTYTVGVTDLSFNPINAIFGRLLHTPDGRVVTLSYWRQEESESQDEIPYFQRP